MSQKKLLLNNFIKKIVAEAALNEATTDINYQTYIKSLFENWIMKFSASFIEYRKQNFPEAWAIKSLSYTKAYNNRLVHVDYQYIKLNFININYAGCALIFNNKESIYIFNTIKHHNIFNKTSAIFITYCKSVYYWHKNNYLFKLSVSDFETALGVADNYDEFMALCEQMNEKPFQENVNESNKNKLSKLLETEQKQRKVPSHEQRKKELEPLFKKITDNFDLKENLERENSLIIKDIFFRFMNKADGILVSYKDYQQVVIAVYWQLNKVNIRRNVLYISSAHPEYNLSIDDFKQAVEIAETYDEFIVLCEQLNKEYKKEQE